MVIVPPRFLDEIKALPEDILSFQKQVSERFLGRYTGLGVNDTLVHSVKVRVSCSVKLSCPIRLCSIQNFDNLL